VTPSLEEFVAAGTGSGTGDGGGGCDPVATAVPALGAVSAYLECGITAGEADVADCVKCLLGSCAPGSVAATPSRRWCTRIPRDCAI